ncbi:MAG TPA: hypothetical protein PLO61_03750 [Fimbriimonadaceae bacterium]|nr:hypothetical protein [Fimbriimonadaceae bacterium]HRJ32745.1 hypothetical protein [Fimbriimonadaceae bacterium]
MNPLGDRLKAVIRRLGESIPFGFGSEWILAVPPRGTQAFTYLTPAEVDASVRPVLLAYTRYDTPFLAGSLLTVDARDYTVKKAVTLRVRNLPAMVLLVLA